MPSPRILIVEGDSAIADEIRAALEGLGYEPPIVAGTADEAIRAAKEMHPDVALLNEMQVSERLRGKLGEEVVYLSGLQANRVDLGGQSQAPLRRPFRPEDLRAAIHAAWERRRGGEGLGEAQLWLDSALRIVGEGVLITDSTGKIVFMNPPAQALTGWSAQAASGRPVGDVYQSGDAATGRARPCPVTEAMEGRRATTSASCTLVSHGGVHRSVGEGLAAVRDSRGEAIGWILAIRDLTELHRLERDLRLERQRRYREAEKVESIERAAGGRSDDLVSELDRALVGCDVLLAGTACQGPARECLEKMRLALGRATDLARAVRDALCGGERSG